MSYKNWSEGYVDDVDYTSGYYAELNPRNAELAFLRCGMEFPKVKTACELGYGQGLSALIHSACSDIDWYGTDFNPQHALRVRQIAQESGCGFKASGDSFAEYLKRDDLPEFDFIVLHGIWSWVSRGNQQLIKEFISRKLAIGGVVYVSYNTLPGWSMFNPIRQIMKDNADISGATDTLAKIEQSLLFAKDLLASNPIYSALSPSVIERFEKISKSERQYLAHEFFNDNWSPVFFADMKRDMQELGLSYACTATLPELVDSINISNEQRRFLSQINDRYLRQSVFDFIVNQQFRRDYWVRGTKSLTVAEKIDRYRNLSVVLTKNESNIDLNIDGRAGKAPLKKEVYTPIISSLSHRGATLVHELETQLNGTLHQNQIFEAIYVLAAKGALCIANSDDDTAKFRSKGSCLNMEITAKARYGNEFNFLASAVTGGGINVSRFEQLFLRSREQGLQDPREMAEYAWSCLESNEEKLLVDGKPVNDTEQNIDHLIERATEFNQLALPLLQRLCIA